MVAFGSVHPKRDRFALFFQFISACSEPGSPVIAEFGSNADSEQNVSRIRWFRLRLRIICIGRSMENENKRSEDTQQDSILKIVVTTGLKTPTVGHWIRIESVDR